MYVVPFIADEDDDGVPDVPVLELEDVLDPLDEDDGVRLEEDPLDDDGLIEDEDDEPEPELIDAFVNMKEPEIADEDDPDVRPVVPVAPPMELEVLFAAWRQPVAVIIPLELPLLLLVLLVPLVLLCPLVAGLLLCPLVLPV